MHSRGWGRCVDRYSNTIVGKPKSAFRETHRFANMKTGAALPSAAAMLRGYCAMIGLKGKEKNEIVLRTIRNRGCRVVVGNEAHGQN